MFETSSDILYISIAISVFMVSVFLSVALLYLILVLRDVVKITDKTKSIAEQVEEYVMKPMVVIHGIRNFVLPVVEKIREKLEQDEESQ